MLLIGADIETHPIRPGMLAPKVVCGSWDDGERSWVELGKDAGPRLIQILDNSNAHLIYHNATFDLLCWCAEDTAFLQPIFDAYDTGRVRCTMVRQMLLDVALGMRKFRTAADGTATRSTYSLADLVRLYFNEDLPKEDTWRLRYGLLDGVPVEQWPPEATSYAIRDSVEARRVFLAQEKEMIEHFGDVLPNEKEQQQAAWALHLMEAWGIRAEKAYVDKFLDNCREKIQEMQDALKDTGIFKADGSRTMSEIRRRVVASLTKQGVQVPMTEPSARFPEGQVSTDKETLEMTDDENLHILAESMTYAKHLGQWGPVLQAAQDRPVCCRYNPLVDTGRTSCSGGEGQEGTNFQNPPRKGDVRPALVPRAGWVYVFNDADTIELRAHAQNCLELLGWSRMAEMLQRQYHEGGPDLHLILAASILGVSTQEAQQRMLAGDREMDDARQFAKIPNFGFPGGLGAPTFVTYAARQMSKAQFNKWFGETHIQRIQFAQHIRELWFETFPENREYFYIIGGMVDGQYGGNIQQLKSGRRRGRVSFTAAANGFFQGRVADAMKEVLWVLAWECYLGKIYGSSKISPLKGSRPFIFLHDEPGTECPEATAYERSIRQQEITVEVLNKWMPDIPCTSTAVITRRWYKGAKPVKVDGRLVPSRPQSIDNKTIWVHDVLKNSNT